MIKILIDNGSCCGFGNCAFVCPEVFVVDEEDNRAKLLREDVDTFAEQIRRAAVECPTQAIQISDGAG